MTCSIIPVDLAGLAVFVAHRKVILGQREVGAPHRITLLSARQGANSLSDATTQAARSLLGTAKLFFVTHLGDSSLGGYPKRITAGQLYSAGSLNTGPLDPTGVHCKRGKSTTRTPYGVTALGHCHVHTSHHSAADHSETLQRLTRDPYLVLTRHS